MSKKSLLEKAAASFTSDSHYGNNHLTISLKRGPLHFVQKDLEPLSAGAASGIINCEDDSGAVCAQPLSEATTVGDVCKFIAQSILQFTRVGDIPPTKLGNSGKQFEELLMVEAARLESLNTLTMSRYGTQVTLVNGAWLPIPSLPDFEGVVKPGRQFVIEAKVCSSTSLRLQASFLKHRQVSHMLKRSEFGSTSAVFVHFNERIGSSFYEPQFTVALPVRTITQGGWEPWTQYASCKDKKKEFDAVTRSLAEDIGIKIPWHTPARCRTSRPNLLLALQLLEAQQQLQEWQTAN